MNRKLINFMHNNVSDADKLKAQQLTDFNLERGIELDASLAKVGLEQRKAEARRKCAERRAKREAQENEH